MSSERRQRDRQVRKIRKGWRISISDYISAISIAVGLIVGVATIWITVNHFKQARTASYIERVNTPEVVKVRADIDEWLESSVSDVEKLQKLDADKELSASLTMFLNIITELGISYEYNIVSRDMTCEIWYPLIPRYWEKLQFYVYGSRLRGVKVGYYLEYLAGEISTYHTRKSKANKRRYLVPEFYISNGEQVPTKVLIDEPQTSPADSIPSTKP